MSASLTEEERQTWYCGAGEGMTTRAPNEPSSTICHSVVTNRVGVIKRVDVTKRAATGSSCNRVDDLTLNETKQTSIDSSPVARGYRRVSDFTRIESPVSSAGKQTLHSYGGSSSTATLRQIRFWQRTVTTTFQLCCFFFFYFFFFYFFFFLSVSRTGLELSLASVNLSSRSVISPAGNV